MFSIKYSIVKGTVLFNFRPLEKGKKVKEKFDAIFGITEYNKCLDNFRAMSKDLDTSIIVPPLIKANSHNCLTIICLYLLRKNASEKGSRVLHSILGRCERKT